MRATISRSELHAFVRTLGGDPDDTLRVEIVPDGVTVTTYTRDEQGRRVVADGDLATEVATIAIVGDGDADTVRMRHPGIGREVDVPASAVGHHAVAGWEVVPPPAEQSAAPESDAVMTALKAESASVEEQPTTEPKKSPRRRKNPEEES
ncbi:hypothetical protein [Actinomadura sediminis]|uniref:DUF3071 domain-containing protein n=1 Tax=Actinomadura sediminis TaxID=1038904 RepID=A0ABW3ESY5_9ACTN